VRKKVISPEQRRRAAKAMVADGLCSGRAALPRQAPVVFPQVPFLGSPSS
jgi:hypothetical protein